MIQELEKEKEILDLKIIKINSAIKELENIESSNTKSSIKKVSKKKRKYVKSGNYTVKKQIEKLEKNNPHRPERTNSGRIKPQRTKLFPEEIDDFIEKKWSTNKDSELRQIIGEKFNRFYSIDQIKAHRRMKGWVADKPGRKVIEKPKNNPKKQEASDDDPDMEDITDMLDDD